MEDQHFKKYQEAKNNKDIKALKEFYEMYPEDVKVKFTYAHVLGRYGDKEEGKKLLRELIDTEAKYFALVELGKLAMQEKNNTKAIEYFTKVIDESNNIKDINICCFELAKIYHARGELTKAYKYHDIILTHTATYKDKIFSNFEQGRIDVELGKYSEARYKFKKALYLAENDRYQATSKNFILLELGMLEKYSDNFDEAKKYFNEILNKKGSQKDKRLAKLELGKVYVREGNYATAKEIYDELEEEVLNTKDMYVNDRNRTLTDINLERAKMYIDFKDYENAIATLESVSSTANNKDTLNYVKIYLAKAYAEIGKTDIAYDMLLELADNVRPRDKQQVYFELGNIAYGVNDIENAYKYFSLCNSANKSIISNNILTILDIKEERYVDAFFKLKDSIDNKVKVDPKLAVYISNKLGVAFNGFNEVEYSYAINQILDYSEQYAINSIISKQGEKEFDAKFSKDTDIYKVFLEAQKNLKEEYLEDRLHFLDEYYIPGNVIGVPDEKTILVKTLPKTKDIIYMHPFTESEKVFVKLKKK